MPSSDTVSGSYNLFYAQVGALLSHFGCAGRLAAAELDAQAAICQFDISNKESAQTDLIPQARSLVE